MEYGFKIKIISTKRDALRVWKFFLIPNIIGPISKGEKEQFKKNILATLDNTKGAFFYIENHGEIIGAIGAWENYLCNGGFVIEH